MIEAGILLFLILILITFALYIWRRTTGGDRRKLHLAGRVAALSLMIVPLALFVTYKLMNARTYQVFGHIVPRVDVSRPLIALTFDDGPQAPYTNELPSVLRSHAQPGSIILLHAETGSRGQSLKAVPGIIEKLKSKGYSFVTVSELLAAEIRVSGRQPTQSREPKQGLEKGRLRRGKQILQRAQRAMGGAEKLAAVKDVTHKLEVALEPATGGFRIKQVSLYVAPNHIRQEQETPFGNIKVYTDGKLGWLATPQGVQPIPADVLESAKGVVFRQPTTLMLSDRDASRSVAAVSNSAVEISTTDGQSVRIEFDSVTGLPARQLYLEIGAAGPRERTEIFSDWRDVGGIKMPYKAVQQENGAKMLEVTVSEYRINSGITADLLSKRP